MVLLSSLRFRLLPQAMVAAAALLGLAISSAPARAQQDITYEIAYQKMMEAWKKDDDKLDYAGALGKGDEAWSNIKIASAKQQLTEVQAEKDAATKEMKAAEQVALQFYKITLAKAPAETEENQNTINENRDRVAYLAYQNGQFNEATIVGEYLARKFPKDQFAIHSAQIATAAYLQSYNKAKPEDKGAFLTRLVDLTAFMADTWSDKPEGQEALGRLGQYAMAAGNVDQARSIMDKMPKDSEHRYALGLKLAQGMWYDYVKSQQLPEDKRPKPEALEKLKNDAKSSLRASTEWIRGKKAGQVDYPLVAGELSLVQIYNQLGEFENAKKILEIPKTGLLELAKMNLEVLRQGKINLREEIYKAAMRTYLGLKDYAKAEVIVTALSSIGGKGVDSAAITRLFASLSKQVVDELAAMRKANAPAKEIKIKLDTLSGLLEKVVERKEGHTFGTLSWPAQTLFDQAEILREEGGEPAGPFYEKAIAIYEEILKRAKAEPGFAQPGSIMAIRETVASSHRNVGHHKEALAQFLEILREYPTRIKSQIEAAQTLQDLAKLTKDPDMYDRAMKGSNPEKPKEGKGPEANLIWGWGKISLMTQESKQNIHEQTYYTARYNLAYCRLMQAMLQDDKKKAEGLRMAENDVRVTYTLSHAMGGPDWQGKFNELLKAIQQAQGKEATGLPKKEEAKEEPKKK